MVWVVTLAGVGCHGERRRMTEHRYLLLLFMNPEVVAFNTSAKGKRRYIMKLHAAYNLPRKSFC